MGRGRWYYFVATGSALVAAHVEMVAVVVWMCDGVAVECCECVWPVYGAGPSPLQTVQLVPAQLDWKTMLRASGPARGRRRAEILSLRSR